MKQRSIVIAFSLLVLSAPKEGVNRTEFYGHFASCDNLGIGGDIYTQNGKVKGETRSTAPFVIDELKIWNTDRK